MYCRCMKIDPKLRSTASDILHSHPFLAAFVSVGKSKSTIIHIVCKPPNVIYPFLLLIQGSIILGSPLCNIF